MILVTTVWHSGTHSLVKDMGLDDKDKQVTWDMMHCCDSMVDASSDNEMHITIRDPFHVAMSWANRGRIGLSDRIDRKWYLQWRCLSEIAPVATIHPVEELGVRLHSHSDELGLYEAYHKQDFDKIYDHIPREMIDYALECVKPYR